MDGRACVRRGPEVAILWLSTAQIVYNVAPRAVGVIVYKVVGNRFVSTSPRSRGRR